MTSNEKLRHISLLDTLKIAEKEIKSNFSDEKNSFVMITDKDLLDSTTQFLQNIRTSTLNDGIYILHVGKKFSNSLFRKKVGFYRISANTTAAIDNLPFLRGTSFNY